MKQKIFEIGTNASKTLFNSIEKDAHLLLLYEDVPKALKIQIDFIKKGLQKGEVCIFAMPYTFNIEEELTGEGIDVQRFKRKKQLHIIPVNTTKDNSEAVTIFKDFCNTILSISNNKIRVCGMLDFDMSTKEGMDAFITAETASHENFHCFNGSWLCSYNIAKIEDKANLSWIKKLFKCHDSVIVAPLNDSGIAFDLN